MDQLLVGLERLTCMVKEGHTVSYREIRTHLLAHIPSTHAMLSSDLICHICDFLLVSNTSVKNMKQNFKLRLTLMAFCGKLHYDHLKTRFVSLQYMLCADHNVDTICSTVRTLRANDELETCAMYLYKNGDLLQEVFLEKNRNVYTQLKTLLYSCDEAWNATHISFHEEMMAYKWPHKNTMPFGKNTKTFELQMENTKLVMRYIRTQAYQIYDLT